LATSRPNLRESIESTSGWAGSGRSGMGGITVMGFADGLEVV
jgi:hypothetical protein